MNKFTMIMIMLLAVIMTSGCVDMKKYGAEAAEGALRAAEDFGIKFSEKKNAAELAAAVTEGKEFGIEYDDIDTDGDGVYSGAEAVSFNSRIIQEKLGDIGKPITDKLLQGDFKGAEAEAKEAGADVWAMIKDAILTILVTGGTGKIILNRHRRDTIDATHEERDGKRLLRGEPVGTKVT